MKILIFINSLCTGGAERQVVQDANMLSTEGHDVTVCFSIEGSMSNQLLPNVQAINLKTKTIIKALILLLK